MVVVTTIDIVSMSQQFVQSIEADSKTTIGSLAMNITKSSLGRVRNRGRRSAIRTSQPHVVV